MRTRWGTLAGVLFVGGVLAVSALAAAGPEERASGGAGGGQVFLPWSRYLELRGELPLTGWQVLHAAYRIEPLGSEGGGAEEVRFLVDLRGRRTSPGPGRLELPAGGIAWESAWLDGQDVQVVEGPTGGAAIPCEGPGVYRVRAQGRLGPYLDEETAGGRAVGFRFQPVGCASATLWWVGPLPEGGVSVEPAVPLGGRTGAGSSFSSGLRAEEGMGFWLFPHRAVTIRWGESGADGGTSKGGGGNPFIVDVDLHGRPGVLTVTAWLPMESGLAWSLVLPEGGRVDGVEGVGVGRVVAPALSVSRGGRRVRLRSRVEGEDAAGPTQARLRYGVPLGGQPVGGRPPPEGLAVPLPRPERGAAVLGEVRLSSGPGVSLKLADKRGPGSKSSDASTMTLNVVIAHQAPTERPGEVRLVEGWTLVGPDGTALSRVERALGGREGRVLRSRFIDEKAAKGAYAYGESLEGRFHLGLSPCPEEPRVLWSSLPPELSAEGGARVALVSEDSVQPPTWTGRLRLALPVPDQRAVGLRWTVDLPEGWTVLGVEAGPGLTVTAATGAEDGVVEEGLVRGPWAGLPVDLGTRLHLEGRLAAGTSPQVTLLVVGERASRGAAWLILLLGLAGPWAAGLRHPGSTRGLATGAGVALTATAVLALVGLPVLRPLLAGLGVGLAGWAGLVLRPHPVPRPED